MRSHRNGFTLVELMISIVILSLISTATVFSLRTTRENDELNTAARLLAGDIRNVQARALAARNVRMCTIGGGSQRVCEDENTSVIACTGSCTPLPPPRFGMRLEDGREGYLLFADVNVEDWRWTNTEETLLARSLNPLGGGKVQIDELLTDVGTLAVADVGVGRQNGTMRIEACGETGLPSCSPSEPRTLLITLRHGTSGKTITVDMNAVTGRVSIQ
ncbi:MAG: type II secretion system protein [Patescibacteria group bacterium]|jgi:prepilin-type N-terminal cleavage/methylation domain-containing protein